MYPAALAQAASARAEKERAVSLRGTDPEAAATSLRRAWLFAQSIEDARERQSIQGQVSDALRDLDRHGLRTVRAENRILDGLREIATRYTGMGWLDTAERFLRAAETLMPEAVATDIRSLRQRRAEQVAGEPPSGQSTAGILREWFEGGDLPYHNPGWTFDDDGLRSPPCEGKGWESTTMIVSTRRFSGEGRIRCHFKMGPMGRAGFAFAVRPGGDRPSFHLFSVFYEKNSTIASCYRVDESEARHVESANIPLTVVQQKGWVEVDIVLSGTMALMRAGPQETPLAMHVPGGTEGRLGFYITGDSPLRDPVHFHNFTLERFAPLE